MRLLPFERIRLLAPGPTAATMAKLQHQVGKDIWVPIFQQRPRELFLGVVNVDTFRVRRNITYRNSWQPVLEGRVVDLGTATEIRVLFRLMAFPMVFTALWIGLATLAALPLTWRILEGGAEFRWTAIAVWAMPLFGYGLCMGGYTFERNRSLSELKKLLSAHEIDKHGDPSEPSLQAHGRMS